MDPQRTSGSVDCRPNASNMPNGNEPTTATKVSTTFSIRPPQSPVATGARPNTPPISSTPPAIGMNTSSASSHQPRRRGANSVPADSSTSSTKARSTRQRSGCG